MVSQDCQGDRVERAGCDIVAQAEGTGAASELAGGASGEGDGENPAGVDGAGRRLPGDAAGEDTCLPDPAPATMHSGVAEVVTASRCSG